MILGPDSLACSLRFGGLQKFGKPTLESDLHGASELFAALPLPRKRGRNQSRLQHRQLTLWSWSPAQKVGGGALKAHARRLPLRALREGLERAARLDAVPVGSADVPMQRLCSFQIVSSRSRRSFSVCTAHCPAQLQGSVSVF